MTNLIAILADAAATQPATQPADIPWWATLFGPNGFLWIMVAVMLLLFFMSSRSKKQQQQKRQDMLNQLKKGDRIQTIGGILGTVVEVRDSDVVVKVDESSNTKIRFTRSAIHTVVEEQK